MKLSAYIESIGDRAFAQVIGASRRAVTDWRLGNRLPRPRAAQRIVKASKGAVSLSDIYGSAK